MNLNYPYAIDGRGRTTEAQESAWVRGLIEQILFTSPGERAMRPDFGSGVMQLVFAPNSAELAAATQMLVQGALQQWLAEIIAVHSVVVSVQESTLQITVDYQLRRTQQREVHTFERGGFAT